MARGSSVLVPVVLAALAGDVRYPLAVIGGRLCILLGFVSACSSSGSSGAPCVPAICGHTYQCSGLGEAGNPAGPSTSVLLSTNAQGACVSTVGGAQGEAVYQCDGHVTFGGSTLSTWSPAQDGYTVCASGCERCSLADGTSDASTGDSATE